MSASVIASTNPSTTTAAGTPPTLRITRATRPATAPGNTLPPPNTEEDDLNLLGNLPDSGQHTSRPPTPLLLSKRAKVKNSSLLDDLSLPQGSKLKKAKTSVTAANSPGPTTVGLQASEPSNSATTDNPVTEAEPSQSSVVSHNTLESQHLTPLTDPFWQPQRPQRIVVSDARPTPQQSSTNTSSHNISTITRTPTAPITTTPAVPHLTFATPTNTHNPHPPTSIPPNETTIFPACLTNEAAYTMPITDPIAKETHSRYLGIIKYWPQVEIALSSNQNRPPLTLAVLRKVAKNEFVDLAKLEPDVDTSDKHTLEIDPQGTIHLTEKHQSQKIRTFTDLISAIRVLGKAIRYFYPHRINEIEQYIDNLISDNKAGYLDQALINYDKAFRQAVALQPAYTLASTIDRIRSEHLHSAKSMIAIYRASNNDLKTASFSQRFPHRQGPPTRSFSKSFNKKDQICNNYNHNRCKSPCPHSRKHICSDCGEQHSKKDCKSNKTE